MLTKDIDTFSFNAALARMHSAYPGAASVGCIKEVSKDTDLCIEIFGDLIEKGHTSADLLKYFRDNSFGATVASNNYPIILLMQAFEKEAMSNPDLCEWAVLSYSANSVLGKDAFREGTFYHSNCIIRKLDGTYNENLLTHLIHFKKGTLFKDIFDKDDLAALNHTLAHGQSLGQFKGNSIQKYSTNLNIIPGTKCYAKIFDAVAKDTPYAYLRSLLNISNSDESRVDEIYKPDLAKKIGAEFFYNQINQLCSTPAQAEIVLRLVRDGADWYGGLKQYECGHHVYASIRSRVPDPLAELKELLSVMPKYTQPYTRSRSVVFNILKAIEPDLMKQAVHTPHQAKALYEATSDSYYIGLCTTAMRKKLMMQDFGL